MERVKIHAGVFFHSVHHCDTFKRFPEIHLDTVVGNLCGAKHFQSHVAVQFFCEIHHAIIVRISLVEFHQRKFRVVAGVNALVSKDAPNLKDTLQAADNQPL